MQTNQAHYEERLTMRSETEGQRDKAGSGGIKLLVAAVILLVVLLVLLFLPGQDESQPLSTPAESLPAQTVPLEPKPADPVPPSTPEPEASEPEALSFAELAEEEVAGDEVQPLPALNDSDQPITEALESLSADGILLQWLVPEEVIRKFVRAVENLRQGKLVHKHRPLVSPRQPFFADKIGQQYRMSLKAYRRYDPYVNALESLDMKALVGVYRRYYPLLQQAYGELGLGNNGFHASLLGAIDTLLAAPEVEGEILLNRPSVMYKYADPALEQLPGGHKLMLRLGPDNTRRVKASLRRLRQALAE